MIEINYIREIPDKNIREAFELGRKDMKKEIVKLIKILDRWPNDSKNILIYTKEFLEWVEG